MAGRKTLGGLRNLCAFRQAAALHGADDPLGPLQGEGRQRLAHNSHEWDTASEGEQRQLDNGRKLYTVLFSHPAVDAIIWWDFSDRNSWAGAPAGLLRKDMSPKPLYDWLLEAFHHTWTTDIVVQSDASGTVKLRAFYGEYELTANDGTGTKLESKVTFAKKGPEQPQAVLR